MVAMLVGNKLDIKTNRAISKEEGLQFAKDNDLLYTEVSASTGDGVN